MKLAEINPFVRYAKQHTVHFNSESYSRCYDCRLFYYLSAEGTIETDGRKYNISNNTVVYLPPASRYRQHFTPGHDFRALVLNFDLCQQYSHVSESLHVATDESFDCSLVPQYELPDEFSNAIIRQGAAGAELIIACIEEFLTKKNFYRESASAHAKSFLIELLREETAGGHSQLVRSVIELIKENYANSALNNIEIANRLGYHPYHISKLVKAATGRTLNQYLTFYRIQCAKQLLASYDMSIEMVAWRSGFSSSAYFIKIFREHTGMTPAKYRAASVGVSM